MGLLGMCGVCCMCLSVWAVIQLSLMGLFYFLETPILIEDVEEHHPKDFKDFIKKTRANYRQNAINCWITAGIYALTFFISIACIKKAKLDDDKKKKILMDDEQVCIPKLPKPPQLLVGDTKEDIKRKKKQAKRQKAIRKRSQSPKKQSPSPNAPKKELPSTKKAEKTALKIASDIEMKTKKAVEKAKKTQPKVPSRPSSPKRKKEK